MLPKEGVDEVGDGLCAHSEVLELASARGEAKRARKSAREGEEREKRERNEGDGCRGRAKVKGGKSDVKTKKKSSKKVGKICETKNRFL